MHPADTFSPVISSLEAIVQRLPGSSWWIDKSYDAVSYWLRVPATNTQLKTVGIILSELQVLRYGERLVIEEMLLTPPSSQQKIFIETVHPKAIGHWKILWTDRSNPVQLSLATNSRTHTLVGPHEAPIQLGPGVHLNGWVSGHLYSAPATNTPGSVVYSWCFMVSVPIDRLSHATVMLLPPSFGIPSDRFRRGPKVQRGPPTHTNNELSDLSGLRLANCDLQGRQLHTRVALSASTNQPRESRRRAGFRQTLKREASRRGLKDPLQLLPVLFLLDPNCRLIMLVDEHSTSHTRRRQFRSVSYEDLDRSPRVSRFTTRETRSIQHSNVYTHIHTQTGRPAYINGASISPTRREDPFPPRTQSSEDNGYTRASDEDYEAEEFRPIVHTPRSAFRDPSFSPPDFEGGGYSPVLRHTSDTYMLKQLKVLSSSDTIPPPWMLKVNESNPLKCPSSEKSWSTLDTQLSPQSDGPAMDIRSHVDDPRFIGTDTGTESERSHSGMMLDQSQSDSSLSQTTTAPRRNSIFEEVLAELNAFAEDVLTKEETHESGSPVQHQKSDRCKGILRKLSMLCDDEEEEEEEDDVQEARSSSRGSQSLHITDAVEAIQHPLPVSCRVPSPVRLLVCYFEILSELDEFIGDRERSLWPRYKQWANLVDLSAALLRMINVPGRKDQGRDIPTEEATCVFGLRVLTCLRDTILMSPVTLHRCLRLRNPVAKTDEARRVLRVYMHRIETTLEEHRCWLAQLAEQELSLEQPTPLSIEQTAQIYSQRLVALHTTGDTSKYSPESIPSADLWDCLISWCIRQSRFLKRYLAEPWYPVDNWKRDITESPDQKNLMDWCQSEIDEWHKAEQFLKTGDTSKYSPESIPSADLWDCLISWCIRQSRFLKRYLAEPWYPVDNWKRDITESPDQKNLMDWCQSEIDEWHKAEQFLKVSFSELEQQVHSFSFTNFDGPSRTEVELRIRQLQHRLSIECAFITRLSSLITTSVHSDEAGKHPYDACWFSVWTNRISEAYQNLVQNWDSRVKSQRREVLCQAFKAWIKCAEECLTAISFGVRPYTPNNLLQDSNHFPLLWCLLCDADLLLETVWHLENSPALGDNGNLAKTMIPVEFSSHLGEIRRHVEFVVAACRQNATLIPTLLQRLEQSSRNMETEPVLSLINVVANGEYQKEIKVDGLRTLVHRLSDCQRHWERRLQLTQRMLDLVGGPEYGNSECIQRWSVSLCLRRDWLVKVLAGLQRIRRTSELVEVERFPLRLLSSFEVRFVREETLRREQVFLEALRFGLDELRAESKIITDSLSVFDPQGSNSHSLCTTLEELKHLFSRMVHDPRLGQSISINMPRDKFTTHIQTHLQEADKFYETVSLIVRSDWELTANSDQCQFQYSFLSNRSGEMNRANKSIKNRLRTLAINRLKLLVSEWNDWKAKCTPLRLSPYTAGFSWTPISFSTKHMQGFFEQDSSPYPLMALAEEQESCLKIQLESLQQCSMDDELAPQMHSDLHERDCSCPQPEICSILDEVQTQLDGADALDLLPIEKLLYILFSVQKRPESEDPSVDRWEDVQNRAVEMLQSLWYRLLSSPDQHCRVDEYFQSKRVLLTNPLPDEISEGEGSFQASVNEREKIILDFKVVDTMLSTLQQAMNTVPPGMCESRLQWLDSLRPTWERVRTDVLSELQVCCQNSQHAVADILNDVEDRLHLATQLLPIDSEFGQDRLQQAYRHLELACWLFEKQGNRYNPEQPNQEGTVPSSKIKQLGQRIGLVENSLHCYQALNALFEEIVGADELQPAVLEMTLVKLDVLEAQLDNLLSIINPTAKKRQPDQPPQKEFSELLSSKQIELIRHILLNRLHYHEFLVSAPVRRHQRLNYSLLQVDNSLDLIVHQLRRFLDVRQPENPSATYALLLRLPNDSCIAQLPSQLAFLDQYCEEVKSCVSEKPITYPLHLRELGRVEQYPEDDGTSAYVADLMQQIASSLLDRAQISEYAKGLSDWSEKLHDLVRALSDHVRELVDAQKQLYSALPNLTGLHLGELAEAVAILEVRADADRSDQSGLHSTTQGRLAQHIKFNGATNVKSIPEVRSPVQFSKTSFEPSSRLNAEEVRRKRLNLRDLLGSHSCVYPECKRAREEWATCRTVVSKEQTSIDTQVRQVFIELVHFYARLRKDLIEHREPGIEDTRSSDSADYAIRVKWHRNASMIECYEDLMERVRQLSACELPQVVKLRAKARSLEQLWVGPRGESSQHGLKRLPRVGSGSANGRDHTDDLDHSLVKSVNGRSSVSSTESSSDIHIHLGDHLENERLLNGARSTWTTATLHLAQAENKVFQKPSKRIDREADRSEQAIEFTQASISVRKLDYPRPPQLDSASIGAEYSVFSVVGDASEASSNLPVSGLNNPVYEGERMLDKNHSAWVTEPPHHSAVPHGSSEMTDKQLAKQERPMEVNQPFAPVRKSDESKTKTSCLSVEHKEFTFSVHRKCATGESVSDSSNPSGEHQAECMLNGDRSAQITEVPHLEKAGIVVLGKTSENTEAAQKSAPLWGFDGLNSGPGFQSVCTELPTLPADTKMAFSPADDHFGVQRFLSGNRPEPQLKRDKNKTVCRTPEQAGRERSEQEQDTGVDQQPPLYGISDVLESQPALSPVDLRENSVPVDVNMPRAPGGEKSPAVDKSTSLLNAARQAQLMKSYVTKHKRDKRRHRKQQKNSESTVASIGATENRQNGHETTERGRVDNHQVVSAPDRPQAKPFVNTEVHIELLTRTPPGTYELSRIASQTSSSASEETDSNPLPDEEFNHYDKSFQIHPAVLAASPSSNLMVPEVRNGLANKTHLTRQSQQPLRSLFPQPSASSTPSCPASELLPAPVNGLCMRSSLQPSAVQGSEQNGVAAESFHEDNSRTSTKETNKGLAISDNLTIIKQSTIPSVVTDGTRITPVQIIPHAKNIQTDNPSPITRETPQCFSLETTEESGKNEADWITVERDIRRKGRKSGKAREKTSKKASGVRPKNTKHNNAETKLPLAAQTVFPPGIDTPEKPRASDAAKVPTDPPKSPLNSQKPNTQADHQQKHQHEQHSHRMPKIPTTVVCPTEHDEISRSERSAVVTDAGRQEQESWIVSGGRSVAGPSVALPEASFVPFVSFGSILIDDFERLCLAPEVDFGPSYFGGAPDLPGSFSSVAQVSGAGFVRRPLSDVAFLASPNGDECSVTWNAGNVDGVISSEHFLQASSDSMMHSALPSLVTSNKDEFTDANNGSIEMDDGVLENVCSAPLPEGDRFRKNVPVLSTKPAPQQNLPRRIRKAKRKLPVRPMVNLTQSGFSVGGSERTATSGTMNSTASGPPTTQSQDASISSGPPSPAALVMIPSTLQNGISDINNFNLSALSPVHDEHVPYLEKLCGTNEINRPDGSCRAQLGPDEFVVTVPKPIKRELELRLQTTAWPVICQTNIESPKVDRQRPNVSNWPKEPQTGISHDVVESEWLSEGSKSRSRENIPGISDINWSFSVTDTEHWASVGKSGDPSEDNAKYRTTDRRFESYPTEAIGFPQSRVPIQKDSSRIISYLHKTAVDDVSSHTSPTVPTSLEQADYHKSPDLTADTVGDTLFRDTEAAILDTSAGGLKKIPKEILETDAFKSHPHPNESDFGLPPQNSFNSCLPMDPVNEDSACPFVENFHSTKGADHNGYAPQLPMDDWEKTSTPFSELTKSKIQQSSISLNSTIQPSSPRQMKPIGSERSSTQYGSCQKLLDREEMWIPSTLHIDQHGSVDENTTNNTSFFACHVASDAESHVVETRNIVPTKVDVSDLNEKPQTSPLYNLLHSSVAVTEVDQRHRTAPETQDNSSDRLFHLPHRPEISVSEPFSSSMRSTPSTASPLTYLPVEELSTGLLEQADTPPGESLHTTCLERSLIDAVVSRESPAFDVEYRRTRYNSVGSTPHTIPCSNIMTNSLPSGRSDLFTSKGRFKRDNPEIESDHPPTTSSIHLPVNSVLSEMPRDTVTGFTGNMTRSSLESALHETIDYLGDSMVRRLSAVNDTANDKPKSLVHPKEYETASASTEWYSTTSFEEADQFDTFWNEMSSRSPLEGVQLNGFDTTREPADLKRLGRAVKRTQQSDKRKTIRDATRTHNQATSETSTRVPVTYQSLEFIRTDFSHSTDQSEAGSNTKPSGASLGLGVGTHEFLTCSTSEKHRRDSSALELTYEHTSDLYLKEKIQRKSRIPVTPTIHWHLKVDASTQTTAFSRLDLIRTIQEQTLGTAHENKCTQFVSDEEAFRLTAGRQEATRQARDASEKSSQTGLDLRCRFRGSGGRTSRILRYIQPESTEREMGFLPGSTNEDTKEISAKCRLSRCPTCCRYLLPFLATLLLLLLLLLWLCLHRLPHCATFFSRSYCIEETVFWRYIYHPLHTLRFPRPPV
ncbi:hypothetical protein CRM22_010702 [Opisthorchis felineus]|uniref:Uncharacterized protein n=1 Tax=Opisthorchis felineus TaxID=147828 RepID=A0A4S2KQE0_OPIFE|nr:hypothetical protein CRM22_010702 [Opisthorchis felineus]